MPFSLDEFRKLLEDAGKESPEQVLERYQRDAQAELDVMIPKVRRKDSWTVQHGTICACEVARVDAGSIRRQ